jgi:hypothetical protein
MRRALQAASCVLILVAAGCGREPPAAGPARPEAPEAPAAPAATAPAPTPAPQTPSVAEKVVLTARREAEKATPYQGGYHRIKYPGGDVPTGGVCTDLVVRAFRGAGLDLQRLVHEDMRAHFAAYPRLWGAARPDPNIDHRRVPNLIRFFERRGAWLAKGTAGPEAAGWQPGDVVFWDLPNGLKHCGIVSDRKGASGLPLVIHNLSRAAEEDCLASWKITGHARYPKPD